MLTRLLLYHPTDVPVERLAHGGWEREELAVDGGLRLQGLVRPARAPDVPWLIFFGGNAMGLDAAQAVLGMVAGRDAPWGLAAFAYRGYDGSEGKPSERALFADAQAIASFVIAGQGVSPGHLALIGQSLGSGVAVELGVRMSRRGAPPGAVVLLSPYSSMDRVFDDHVPLVPVRWLVFERFASERIIGELDAPVLLIHGERDSLIGIDHSHRLLARLGDRGRLEVLPGRDHNDLWEERRTVLAIRELIARGR